MRLVEVEERNGAGCGCLEESWVDEAQVVEGRTGKDRIPERPAHGRHDLVDRHGWGDLDAQTLEQPQVGLVRLVPERRLDPPRGAGPVVPDETDVSHSLTDRLHRPEHPAHRPPPEPVAPDVDHPVVTGAWRKALFRCGVVTVEEICPD